MASEVPIKTTALRRQRSSTLGKNLLHRLVATLVLALAVAAVIALHGVKVLALLSVLGLVVFWLVERSARVTLTVGMDGVYVEDRRGKRFIPFSQIEGIQRVGSVLTMLTRQAAPVVFRASSAPGLRRELDSVIRRIESACGQSAATLQRLLERNGAGVPEWMANLRTIATRESYREESLDVRRLWDIVESGSVDASQRAAAAVALMDHLDEDDVSRLRVAADACAAPEVRTAMEAVADGDEERIKGALEAL
jgi:hypothetical protein